MNITRGIKKEKLKSVKKPGVFEIKLVEKDCNKINAVQKKSVVLPTEG